LNKDKGQTGNLIVKIGQSEAYNKKTDGQFSADKAENFISKLKAIVE
jgi:hypothetical protein